MKNSVARIGRRSLARLIAVGGLSWLAMGCGGSQGVNSPATFDQGSLDEVGELYRSVLGRTGKPPGSLKDLAQGRDQFLLGYNSVASGDVIVYWGVTPVPGDASTEEILGYKSIVPTAGGAVLLKNGKIENRTVDQFKTAPKPAGATSK